MDAKRCQWTARATQLRGCIGKLLRSDRTKYNTNAQVDTPRKHGNKHTTLHRLGCVALHVTAQNTTPHNMRTRPTQYTSCVAVRTHRHNTNAQVATSRQHANKPTTLHRLGCVSLHLRAQNTTPHNMRTRTTQSQDTSCVAITHCMRPNRTRYRGCVASPCVRTHRTQRITASESAQHHTPVALP